MTKLFAVAVAIVATLGSSSARADGNLQNVNHIIIVMQENHSFDNYFGVLPFVPNSPYHNARGTGRHRACPPTDSTCVDGLTCKVRGGTLACKNRNPDLSAPGVRAFHDPRYCTGPDLEHGWVGSHQEGNFRKLNNMLKSSPNNGFVRVNAVTQDPDQAIDHDTMGYYDDGDLPFYYDLATTFAISDRYFCAVIGPTFPNRAYFLAGTSFGHLTTSEIITPGGYKPITGTIFDRMQAAGITWADYFSDLPYVLMFNVPPGHAKPRANFFVDAAAGTLPQVAFVDPSVTNDQSVNGIVVQTDEHPPANIRAGEYAVSEIVNALRNGPNWHDSILLITYDEHGGFYDHVMPPPASQGGARTPDGIAPGQCADASNLPASAQPGGGVTCNTSKTSAAPGTCPSFMPTGSFPEECASFDQLGYRVPMIAVSPYSKPHYVSHVVNSHPSILALLENRYGLAPLTARDANANDLTDMFDFDTSPSLNAVVTTAPPPREPPTHDPGDPGCPF